MAAQSYSPKCSNDSTEGEFSNTRRENDRRHGYFVFFRLTLYKILQLELKAFSAFQKQCRTNWRCFLPGMVWVMGGCERAKSSQRKPCQGKHLHDPGQPNANIPGKEHPTMIPCAIPALVSHWTTRHPARPMFLTHRLDGVTTTPG